MSKRYKPYLDDVVSGMEKYLSSYERRYPHLPFENAIRATRNWAEGLARRFRGGFIDPATQEKIDRQLNKLRLKT